MNHFIFSLNATVPIFLVIVGGYLLRKIQMLDDAFVKTANKFNFRVTLPAMLFLDLATADFGKSFDGRFILFCALATLCSILAIWAGAKLFCKDKRIIGEFVQASYRSSAAVLGIAFIVNICKTAGAAPLMIIGAVPVYNIFAVLILTLEGEDAEEGKLQLKKAVIGILTNPIIDSIALGFVFSLLKVHIPQMAYTTLDHFAKMATPLALVCIGAGFEGRKAIKMVKPAFTAAMIKLVVLPAIFLPIAIGMGFRGAELIAAIIMLGSPTTPSSYIMARNMGHEGVLTSSVVVLTTILSAVTITLQVYLVKAFGLI